MRLGLEGGAAKRQRRVRIATGLLRASVFFAATATSYTFYATQAQAQTYRFDSVVVDGNARIGQSAILSQTGIARGQTLSAGQLNDAYQRLVASGLFETVEIAPQGNTLRITVVELPTINRISF